MANFTKNTADSGDLIEFTIEENHIDAPIKPMVLNLANGLVQFARKEQPMSDDGKKDPGVGCFLFCNHKMTKPIQLYSRQVHTLVKHLPTAYSALNEGDTSYCLVIAVNKTQRVTLEVNLYNDKHYLFLKKCFKPEETADNPQQDWIYTRSSLLFDPKTDDPDAMLAFVLSCY